MCVLKLDWIVAVTVVHLFTIPSFLAVFPSVGKFMAGPQFLDAVRSAKDRQVPLHLAEFHDGAECDRICTEREAPRLCYFRWIAEHYAAMGS